MKARGSWAGSYPEVLGWAAEKLAIASARDRERGGREGWGSPVGLLERWARLHRFDWEVTGDRLTVKARPKATKKAPPGV